MLSKKAKGIFRLNLYIFVSMSVLISQLPLSGIFLYQKGADKLPITNVAEAADADAWYDTDWSYRKEITIDHTKVASEALTDYPFLFSATNDDFRVIAQSGKVGQADGGDILFTLGDGTTKLAHELEDYDSATGKVDAWVKIPSLSYTEDTKLYVYYGNATAADQQSKDNVWDANYRMVQHLNESPANAAANGHLDSTGNALNGTADLFYSTATTDADGKIGGADIFKDYSYYSSYPDYADIHKYSRVALPSSVLGSEESFTLSSWVKSNAAGAVFSNNDGEVDYCGAPGNPSYAYFLRNVTFNTINNNTSNPYDSVAYRDYTNLSTTVNVGQTYVLYTTNAPYQNHWIKAWIDYNQDGDFSDAGETYTITVNNSYQVGQQVSITIPTSALNGPTRLRVRATGWSEPPACGQDWGTETEDYTVNIQGSAFNKNNVFSFGTFGAGNVGKFTILKNGVAYDALGDANINDSAWHYLSATYGAGGMKLYVDGILKGTNNTIAGALNPLGGGFWVGRYDDDRKGQYGFDGTIDEVRISTSERNAAWIQTEYANQNSPGTFFTLAGGEARIMDHFALSASAAEVTAEDPLTLSIRAINNMEGVFVPYTGDKTLVFSGAADKDADSPTATDKDGDKIDFGDDTVVTFANGVATTTLTMYQMETAHIQITDGTYTASLAQSIVVRSRGVAFVPPTKPVINQVEVSHGAGGAVRLENLPEDITQIAVSSTPDFGDATWEDINDKEKVLKSYETADKIYVKFRTLKGGVSDVLIVEKTRSADSVGSGVPDVVRVQNVNDGDIVKSPDSPDVYIIKYKNQKQYKRLILSPLVFKSYGHLKWENLKIITRAELDRFTTSNLVRETLDYVIYRLFPSGDAGERKQLEAMDSYDADSVYEINAVDRDSYVLTQ